MLCTCMTSFSSRNTSSVAMSYLCVRQSMQNSTPSGKRVSTHTLKTQDKYFFSNRKFACTKFQHLFSIVYYVIKFCQEQQQQKAMVSQYSASICIVFSSPNNDQLQTSSKIISVTKEKLAPYPMSYFHLVVFIMCITLLRIHEFFY